MHIIGDRICNLNDKRSNRYYIDFTIVFIKRMTISAIIINKNDDAHSTRHHYRISALYLYTAIHTFLDLEFTVKRKIGF